MIVPKVHDVVELRQKSKAQEYIYHTTVVHVTDHVNHYRIAHVPIDMREPIGTFTLNKDGTWPEYGIIGCRIVEFAKKKVSKRAQRAMQKGRFSKLLKNPAFVVC